MKNNTLMIDLYELTMAQAYFDNDGLQHIAYFDAFFRKMPFDSGYAIMGGIDNIIDYIENIHFDDEALAYLRSTQKFSEQFLEYLKTFKFKGTIWAVLDGTVIFNNEPLLSVKANLIEAQIIETAILSYLNSCIKYSTAASLLVDVADNIIEFGARRADGPEAALLASKCAYIAGCIGTSNVMAGYVYQIPIIGTMAHSMVSAEKSEYDAFLKYAQSFPNNCVFLIDTYDTLKSGILNAVKVAKEYLEPNGYRLKGVRIDSGDLAYLSKEVRRILDNNDMKDCQITISNGIDAQTLTSLKLQGAAFDSVGAGDNIVAPKERVGVVYKLVAIEENNMIVPRIKVSNDAIKTINPGFKKLYRFYDQKTGFALGDVIALADEVIPEDQYVLIDPTNEFNKTKIKNYVFKELQVPLYENGKLVYNDLSIHEKRDYCKQEKGTMYPEVKRLIKPHKYYIDLSEKLLQLKKDMIQESKKAVGESHE